MVLGHSFSGSCRRQKKITASNLLFESLQGLVGLGSPLILTCQATQGEDQNRKPESLENPLEHGHLAASNSAVRSLDWSIRQ